MSLCEENTAMNLSAFRSPVDDAFNPDGSKVVSPPAVPSLFTFRRCDPGTLDRISLRPGMADTDGSTGSLLSGRPQRRVYLGGSPDGAEGGCLICSLDEHPSSVCPCKAQVPKNTTVGRGCDVVCKVCDGLFSGRCCNQDSGHARLKFCNGCLKYGEHWLHECPQKSVVMMLGPPSYLTAPGPSTGYLRKKRVV